MAEKSNKFVWNATFFAPNDPHLNHCGDEDGEPIFHTARTAAQRGGRFGDTEYSICQLFNITPGCFRKWNQLPRQKDQASIVISAGKTYVVGFKPQPPTNTQPPTTSLPDPKPEPLPTPVPAPPTSQSRRRMPREWEVSDACLAYMHSWERPPLVNGRISGRVFRDTKGSLTIGFGHFIPDHERPRWAAYDPELGGTQELTMAQMQQLFKEDVERLAVNDLVRRIFVPLRQHEFDALVDFIFHRGAGAFRLSGLENYINSVRDGNFDESTIRDCFMLYAFWFNNQTQQWEYVEGFAKRRREEINMFMRGEYTLHR
jgi:GH24 family phage-related lysozyme (muramidase)